MRRFTALIVLVVAGLGVFFFPQASAWQRQRENANRVNVYQSAVSSNESNNALLDQATEYNRALGQQPSQHYASMAAESDSSYQAQLKVGTATEMGQISVPAIDVRLGIYHGVSETVLDIGAGHIYGTSLPVGGESTHSVITSHSGLRHAELFTRLDELEIGDEFFINSAGQTLRYVVDQIKVVTPDDTSAMNVIPGKDYVTLVTCTPRGLNSHRLYVRGERAPLALAETSVTPTAPVPFPWWAIWFGASSLGTIGLCKVLAITTTTKARSQKQTRSPEKSQPAPLQVSAEANHG